MGQSLLNINIHIVFSTKDRQRLITPTLQPRLWNYLAGTARQIDLLPLAIGGTDDHVHLLLGWNSRADVAKVLNTLKSNSSRWMSEQIGKFAWQRSYAAFSVSASNLRAVTTYIENQAEHHKRRDFKQELIALLKKHNVEYDPRYIFE